MNVFRLWLRLSWSDVLLLLKMRTFIFTATILLIEKISIRSSMLINKVFCKRVCSYVNWSQSNFVLRLMLIYPNRIAEKVCLFGVHIKWTNKGILTYNKTTTWINDVEKSKSRISQQMPTLWQPLFSWQWPEMNEKNKVTLTACRYILHH